MKKRGSSHKSPKRTVKTKGLQERITILIDLGDRTSRYCMLSGEGEILVATTKAGMVEAFGSPHWMHLELLQHRSGCARTDISALFHWKCRCQRRMCPSWASSPEASRTRTASVLAFM
jgi:hypothetical protein